MTPVGAQPNIFTVPSGIPFARALCAGLLERASAGPLALADMLVLVPTRRATRALRDAFAEAMPCAALLPRIMALADVDDDPEGSDLPDSPDSLPAIAPLRRRFLLATLVQHWGAARGSPIPLHHALNSADELGGFLDEAITQGADLSRLTELAPADLAAHWSEVVSFLNIVAVQWPKLLETENAIEAAERRDGNLRALARKLAETTPKTPVIAAGSTGSIPATAELLKTIAFLPAGAVVLPGLDTSLDEDGWRTLDSSHPQFGLKRLLANIGASRDDVAPWSPLPKSYPERTDRVRFISEALRPPPATDAWLEFVRSAGAETRKGLNNVSLIEARTLREEALVIACAMREALEVPDRKTALVTPDRALARRVAAELGRWDIVVDRFRWRSAVRHGAGHFSRAACARRGRADGAGAAACIAETPARGGGEEPAQFRRKSANWKSKPSRFAAGSRFRGRCAPAGEQKDPQRSAAVVRQCFAAVGPVGDGDAAGGCRSRRACAVSCGCGGGACRNAVEIGRRTPLVRARRRSGSSVAE